MSKKDKGAGDAQDFSGMPAAPITPADIQQKEFRVSRFGGYKMRDVDEFLDHVTEAMTKLVEENQRMRAASGLPAATAIGAPDLADQARQADEIIARARAEAAQILQEARSQAAAVAPIGDAERSAVSAFLSQERGFLQELAALVQGHAESVKGMARAGRAKGVEAAVVPERPPVEEPKEAPPSPPVDTSRSDEPVRVAENRTIEVQEPAPAAVGASESEEDGSGGEGGDPSLRELFWGEE